MRFDLQANTIAGNQPVRLVAQVEGELENLKDELVAAATRLAEDVHAEAVRLTELSPTSPVAPTTPEAPTEPIPETAVEQPAEPVAPETTEALEQPVEPPAEPPAA